MIKMSHQDDFLLRIIFSDDFCLEDRHISVKKLGIHSGLHKDFFPGFEKGQKLFFLPPGKCEPKTSLYSFLSGGRKTVELDQVRILKTVFTVRGTDDHSRSASLQDSLPVNQRSISAHGKNQLPFDIFSLIIRIGFPLPDEYNLCFHLTALGIRHQADSLVRKASDQLLPWFHHPQLSLLDSPSHRGKPEKISLESV